MLAREQVAGGDGVAVGLEEGVVLQLLHCQLTWVTMKMLLARINRQNEDQLLI